MDKLPEWIVFIDDEEPVRRAFVRLMRAEGISTSAYASGAECLETSGQPLPDCIVLDLNMPGMGGFEVLERLAGQAPQVPVILVTGHDTAEVRARALQTGAVAYLQKPFDAQQLLDALRAAMRHGPAGHGREGF
jgi:FixJ family two-component response regulator